MAKHIDGLKYVIYIDYYSHYILVKDIKHHNTIVVKTRLAILSKTCLS